MKQWSWHSKYKFQNTNYVFIWDFCLWKITCFFFCEWNDFIVTVWSIIKIPFIPTCNYFLIWHRISTSKIWIISSCNVPIIFTTMCVPFACILESKYKNRWYLPLIDLPFIYVLDFDPREIIATYNDYICTHICMLANRYMNEWCDHTENIILSM